MRKAFKILGIDCANCAAKLEDALKKIDGVQDVKINFFMEKLTLQANDDDFDDVLERVENAALRFEPDCEIVR